MRREHIKLCFMLLKQMMTPSLGCPHPCPWFKSVNASLPPTAGEARERLALHVLHRALALVPEHVETRPFTHPANPGIPQGRLKIRPATSFLWITSPWKSFKHILWGRYKWYCITLVILFLLFLFLFLFFYSLPSATVDYMLGIY
ncbi:hypothetical protein Pmani_032617 [Petrolisthes manimaculis]|uniref:Ferlin C-terminal domain-containing protein n=1 Tax=Petrolisthes manimaculis TaxID=1843537 RepID=A0AAE1NST2_9EUCA|nr:hypothetical protein Pmani_032617 [Petrolisthes manimaculis]